ncbi:type IV secretion system protein VirB10 [Rhizobium beringeri]
MDDDAARRASEEAERLRKAEELRLARLQSNMLVVDQAIRGENSASMFGGSTAQGSGSAVSADDDPNRKFLQSVGSQDVEKVTASRNDRIDALIPQGTLIRGVLETAIQSDLPGMVRAVTSTEVYSFDGRRILLPKGTMLMGEYKSGMARGQTRILIVWTRALRSDGTSVALGSYGTDDLGRSGLTGSVDKHYLERFGAAAVLSLVGGVSSFVAGLNSDGSSNSSSSSTSSNAQTQAQQTLSQTMAEMANMTLKDLISIPPTIYVDQGTEIMVFVRKDLDFPRSIPIRSRRPSMNFVAPKPDIRLVAPQSEEQQSMWDSLPVYVRQTAQPIRKWLEDPAVIEIMCNRPGEIWIESIDSQHMIRHAVPALDDRAIVALAQMIAGTTQQSVNEETPLLSACNAQRRTVSGGSVPGRRLWWRLCDTQTSHQGYDP